VLEMWFEHVRIAGRALLGRALRSLLTVISITIGALAIVLASSLAESGLATLMRSIEELGGARLLMVVPKPPERSEKKLASGRGGFDSGDHELVSESLPHLDRSALYAGLGKKDALSDAGRAARTDLVAARFGLREPKVTMPVLPLDQITAFLIPGIAFDRAGSRIGWGRGYYDATLGAAPGALRIGLAFECQLVDQIEREPHDAALHYIITEVATYAVV